MATTPKTKQIQAKCSATRPRGGDGDRGLAMAEGGQSKIKVLRLSKSGSLGCSLASAHTKAVTITVVNAVVVYTIADHKNKVF